MLRSGAGSDGKSGDGGGTGTVAKQIGGQPHLTLQEVQQRLAQAHRLRLSVGWLRVVVVQQLRLPLKKVPRCSDAGQRGGKTSGP